MTPTKEHADKIKQLLTYGLVKGKGIQEPGKMCVEAVVCCALGLPHNDNPPCVGDAVRKFKITLNDQNWLSNKSRAEGMARLAIAQLGSNLLGQDEFEQKLLRHIQLNIIIPSFDLIPEDKRIPEHKELKEYCINTFDLYQLKEKFKDYHDDYYYYYYYYYYYDYHDYDYYNNNFGQKNFQKMLHTIAECGVKTLQEMNCLGCQWL